MSKVTIVLAAGAGYVLGARAGQARYEQITQKASELWSHPQVQRGTAQAQEMVRDNAPKVQGKIADVAAEATSKLRSGSHSADTDAASGPGSTSVNPSAGSPSHG